MAVGPSVRCCVYVTFSASICGKLGGSFTEPVNCEPLHAACTTVLAGSDCFLPPQPATRSAAPSSSRRRVARLIGGAVYGPLPAGSNSLDPGLLQRRLRRREPCERHPEGRAADVIQPEPVAELDRRRLTAVLAADPNLQAFLCSSAALDRYPHQVAHAALVERLERI